MSEPSLENDVKRDNQHDIKAISLPPLLQQKFIGPVCAQMKLEAGESVIYDGLDNSPGFINIQPELISRTDLRISLPPDLPLEWAESVDSPPSHKPRSYFLIVWDAPDDYRALRSLPSDCPTLKKAEEIAQHSYPADSGGRQYRVVVSRYIENYCDPGAAQLTFQRSVHFSAYIPGHPDIDVQGFANSCELNVKGGIPPYRVEVLDSKDNPQRTITMHGMGRAAISQLPAESYSVLLRDSVDAETRSAVFRVEERPSYISKTEAREVGNRLLKAAKENFSEKLRELGDELRVFDVVQVPSKKYLEEGKKATGDDYRFSVKNMDRTVEFSIAFAAPRITKRPDGKFEVGDVGLLFNGLSGGNWGDLKFPQSIRDYSGSIKPRETAFYPSTQDKMIGRLLFSVAGAAGVGGSQLIVNDGTVRSLTELLRLNETLATE